MPAGMPLKVLLDGIQRRSPMILTNSLDIRRLEGDAINAGGENHRTARVGRAARLYAHPLYSMMYRPAPLQSVQ
jgi:hypothetical protein